MKKVCEECKQKFNTKDYRAKFCSQSCSATHCNRNNPRNKKSPRICKCGNECRTRRNRYCDECIRSRAFNVRSVNEAQTDKSRRNALIRSTGNICSVCKNKEWNNQPIPIELDHINGDASNNKLENLRLICPNCHAQTSSYKGKNKGRSTRKFYVVSRTGR